MNKNATFVLGRTPDNSGGPGAPAGPVTSLTMPIALRFGGEAWLKTLFALGRRIPKIPEPMYRLAFIHFLRWTIIEEVPDGEGGTKKLRPPCLLFEGDFEGNFHQYVDMFIQTVPVREWAVWNRGAGFPGIRPVARFAQWVHDQSLDADHYWFAYPDATTKMVGAGLRVNEALAAFEAAVDSSATDEEWYEQFEHLLVTVQKDI